MMLPSRVMLSASSCRCIFTILDALSVTKVATLQPKRCSIEVMEKGELVAQTKRANWRATATFPVPDVYVPKLSILDTTSLCLFADESSLIGEIARSLSSLLTRSGKGVFANICSQIDSSITFCWLLTSVVRMIVALHSVWLVHSCNKSLQFLSTFLAFYTTPCFTR